MIKITGKRIQLREINKKDAQDIYETCQDITILDYTFVPCPYKLQHALDFIKITKKDIKEKKSFELGIEIKETGKIIGMIGLKAINKTNKSSEIGYWLKKEYRGKGLIQEAIKLILEFGFKKLKLERIWARVFSLNTASFKVLEKSGFKYEGCLRKASFRKGKWYDNLIYSILKEEFK